MRYLVMIGLILGMLVTVSCVPSVHPWYTGKDIVMMKSLEGVWQSDKGYWDFRLENDTTYTLNYVDQKSYDTTGENAAKFKFVLFLVNKSLYGDMLIDKYNPHNEMAKNELFPIHMVLRCIKKSDSWEFQYLNSDWFEQKDKKHQLGLKHETTKDNGIIITAPSTELHHFLNSYGLDSGFFSAKSVILTPCTTIIRIPEPKE